MRDSGTLRFDARRRARVYMRRASMLQRADGYARHAMMLLRARHDKNDKRRAAALRVPRNRRLYGAAMI